MIDIPQDPEGFFGERAPGWWHGTLDGRPVVNLRCGGKCRRHAGHMSDHTIAEDGTVNPSILCPSPDCGWHVYGRLVGWDGGRREAG
jgi:hypothetical protein